LAAARCLPEPQPERCQCRDDLPRPSDDLDDLLSLLYLQQVLGYSALRAGASLVPLTLLSVVGSFVCRSLVPVFGTRNLTLVGALITAAGLAWLSAIPATPPTWSMFWVRRSCSAPD
jgi:Na+/melibiose symporter-like transporter